MRWKTALTASAMLLAAGAARAASTGQTSLADVQGSSSTTAQGDYIASSGGLNTYYSSFIEVPSGTSRLVVDLFDADVGIGGGGEAGANRDRARDSFDTTASYQLFDPSGTLRATLSGTASSPTGADNAWVSLFDSSTTTAPAFGSVATNVASSGTTSLTVARPTGTVAGDLLLFVLAKDGNGAVNTPTGGTGGWISINEGACTSSACRLGVFRRFALASDPTSYTVTWSGSEEAVGAILRYTGVNATTPVDVSAASTGTNAAPTAPSVTTTVANTRVVRIMAADDNDLDGTPYPGGGHTGRFALESDTGDDTVSGAAADIVQASAGGTGTAAFDLDSSEEWRAVTVALRPVAAAGTPTAGHWELRIDQSSAVTGGDDINAVGVRAHDGNSGSGGTELSVYWDTFATYGTNDPDLTRSYTQHPWITSGCLFDQNDFDWDSNSGSTGSTSYSSRTGAFNTSVSPLSANDVWQNSVRSGWTTDAGAVDYGIWSLTTSITGYVAGGIDNGNYGQIYLGNSALANPPPSGQPLSNIFRIYLPTDGGAAPVKPYLEQLLTHVSGPNPPQSGQTSRLQVTVRLVNPTASAITFSSPTNVVTANVPGSGVVYAGSAVVSQGTLVSQPSVGGTGNVVWNPGTVAAGSTQLLGYRVDVTFTAPGQRRVVTGTPTSGGTTARYVDETGNTTQARATYALGPLCEVAATANVATHALVGRLGAVADAGRTVVEWETTSEAGTLGFRLSRRDPETGRFEPLHDGLLPALTDAPQGATYRFVDEAVSAREPGTYLLVEVDRHGRERRFGPVRMEADWNRRPEFEPFDGPFQALAHPLPARQIERLAAHRRAREAAADQTRGEILEKARRLRVDGVKIAVRREGIHFLSAREVAANLGMPEVAVRAWIRRGLLALTHGGNPVAWLPAAQGQGLYFHGQAADSLFRLDNVYLLRRGRGLTMRQVNLAPGSGGGGGSFPESLHLEEDRFPATVLPLDPASDYWFWQAVVAGDPSAGKATFSLPVPGAVGSGAASLTVRLQGGTDLGISEEHRARVSLDGVELGEATWQGIAAKSATFDVDPALLADGAAEIEVEGILGAGVPASAFFVDAFDLAYRRELSALGDRLRLTAGAAGPVAVDGFADPSVQVFDLSDPARPRLGAGVVVEGAGGGFQARFAARGGKVPYLALSSSAVETPVAVWPDLASGLASDRGAEYVVIAPRELLDGAEVLAEERRRFRGLDTLVVDLEDVYDEFHHGLPSPEAIRVFLAHAWSHWSVRPRFVVLAGDGSYDYRDLLGLGGNLVPPLMVRTASGLFAADSRYGDVAGGDGVPEIAVGRVPALTSQELEAYAAKVTAYENAPGPAPDSVLLFSDDADGEADFHGQSERLAARLTETYDAPVLDLGTLGLPGARQALFDAVQAGSGLVNYFGHGGLQALADEGLLTAGDVPALDNADHPMVLTALTCLVNRFEVPGVLTLGEALVLEAQGGGAAVWAPTGLSEHAEAEILGRAFYDAVREAATPILGEAVTAALARYAPAGADPAMLDVYNLLGDPALRLALQPEPPEPPAGGGEGGE